jgi:hypothetical protein
MDAKKKERLRNVLPAIDIGEAYREKKAGREWLSAHDMAKVVRRTTSTIFNWIRKGKLEGCTVCGIIHARWPQSQGGSENEKPRSEQSH